ncbi:MAG: hypothetical protein KUG79_15920 [Pseudomonadales bacterium]|nr:hypothetical protein [Pseudomonadales bacterium]
MSGTRLKRSEILTIVIAILALGISGVTLYFQFFHSQREVTAYIYEEASDHGIIEVHVMFMNSGTTEEAIAGGRFVFSNCESMNPKTIVGQQMVPIVIGPQEKKFRTLKIETNKKHIVFASSPQLNCNEPAPQGRAFVAVEFSLVSESGWLEQVISTPWSAKCEGFPSVCNIVSWSPVILSLIVKHPSNKHSKATL